MAFEEGTWNYLAMSAEAGLRGQGSVVEGMRRVVEALSSQEKSAATLGRRIWWLNLWLLVFTIAIFGLTTVQVLAGLKIITR